MDLHGTAELQPDCAGLITAERDEGPTNLVADHDLWETVEVKDLGERDLCGLLGRGRLGQQNEQSWRTVPQW